MKVRLSGVPICSTTRGVLLLHPLGQGISKQRHGSSRRPASAPQAEPFMKRGSLGFRGIVRSPFWGTGKKTADCGALPPRLGLPPTY